MGKIRNPRKTKTRRIKTGKTIIGKILCAAVPAVFFYVCMTLQALAFSESDVQARVDAVGKETVAGNVLLWFLCAVAFLKVSQKIDSFMSSLGINVAHTGGSMLAEVLVAARGIGGIREFSSRYFGGGNGGIPHAKAGGAGFKPGGTGGFWAGGLAGIVSRRVTNSAIRTATDSEAGRMPGGGSSTGSGARSAFGSGSGTGSGGGSAFGKGRVSGGLGRAAGVFSNGIGGQMYASSVSRGGDFANGVIGTVAAGSISVTGTMTGDKAADALRSYLGYAALGEGAVGIPTYTDVEIGGGRITGTEVSGEHPEGIAFGMYHAAQYVEPEGAHDTVQAADGTSWYRQYAADAVDRAPYMAADGSIAYKESIVKRMPPPPRRKDRM